MCRLLFFDSLNGYRCLRLLSLESVSEMGSKGDAKSFCHSLLWCYNKKNKKVCGPIKKVEWPGQL